MSSDASQPKPGTARINDGPWLPCRFELDGRHQYVEWSVDVVIGQNMPKLGAGTLELVICDGVTVFGDVIVTDINVSQWNESNANASGNGMLRGAR